MSNIAPANISEAYPELFCTIPPPVKEKKPGQLSDKQIKQFFEEGYVIVEDFFSPEELDPVREGVNSLVDEFAQRLYDAGKIRKLYKDSGFFERLTKIEKDFPGASVVLHKSGKMPMAFKNLLSNERLLNVVEQIIGPDIMGHPVWNLRTKTPKNEQTVVPWHQDAAYMDNDAHKIMIPTAWIPLLDANENNGCLQLVKKAHRSGRLATHTCCAGPTWYVMLEEEEMVKTLGANLEEDIMTCPIPYGGFLFFNNLLPHRSLSNYSNVIRWSLDLRWSKPTDPVGLWGLKEGVLLRSSKDPNLKVDWDAFTKVDRTASQEKILGKDVDEFDSTLSGPWMKKWEIVHHNKHTDAYFAGADSTVNP
ncbi:uncharacterized protein LOC106177776 [Lingula anatina]|uniref:Uncharacterized protein LOC106177776 n=1 Tax=Lingula anatina TaxID=7574 RepID=A0A1S3K0Q4_LINAN|nr:uncharacterized protein LOC106177776 [Lingula anatina]XP_013416112.1 uncharacterized protein LOC106177776 [Lingula anatina]|eukprot:XP_013416111.1 uncharacterized protein LOC106177776 [Lingula anatina]